MSGGPSGPVVAAGAVVWREQDGTPLVLLIHRDHHKDVSLPKGKVDPGEAVPTTAVREIDEETGYRVHLGAPLGTAEYVLPSGRDKVVHYWAARVSSKEFERAGRFTPNDEVASIEWVTLDDARAVTDLGVDGIVLSNHGGRQLDRASVPFHLLPSVVREVGDDTEILLDTGVMSGADIVSAVALGARCTLVGRAYLYGLMAGGEAGVRRAVEILSTQITRTMKLLGVSCLEELSPKHVTQLRRLAPVVPPA